MLFLRSLFVVAIVCAGVLISATAGTSAVPRRALTVRLGAPRLLWKRDFGGKEILTLGPSGAGKLVLFTAPPFDVDHGDWNSRPLTSSVFELASGRKVRQSQIAGLAGSAIADEKRWYAAIPLPLPHSDRREIKPEDFRSELVAYDWASGQAAWRIPCAPSASPIATDGLILHVRSARPGNDNILIATDAATGHEKWRRPGSRIRGLFIVDGLLYAYDESLDTGQDATQGEFLNVLDPTTSKPVKRLRFYEDYRPFSTLASLVWSPKARLLIGAYRLYSVGTQMVEVRAFNERGELAWNRVHIGEFQYIHGVLVCENSRWQGNDQMRYDIPSGVVGLNPATGRNLWRRNDIEYAGLCAWKDTVVARKGATIIGLDPRNGKTVWTLTMPVLPQGNSQRVSRTRRLPAEFSVRAYGPYLAVAQTRQGGRLSRLRIYSRPP